jgi:uncharacterized protein
MLIEIRELEFHPVDFQEELAPGAIDFGPDLRQLSIMHAAGRAQLIEERHRKKNKIRDIRLNGDVAATFEVGCARCLEPVVLNVQRNFDLLYRPQGSDAGEAEIPVTSTEAEISYYQGEGLLLEDALREQVLLSLPVKTICREDCKGLCPHCGRNLNFEQCSCAEPLEDPRWSALKDIRSKFDH